MREPRRVHGHAHTRAGRRWPRTLARFGLALVLAEAALQATAWVLWLAQAQESLPAEAVAGRTILCVGDSFTSGWGASQPSRSYPGRLEHKLVEAGQDWRVVNKGWPGQDSREILLRLPFQLASFRPAAVLVLTGANELRRKPALVRPEELAQPSPDRFPVRCRTWRLLRALADLFAGRRGPVELAAAAQHSFLGEWHHGGRSVCFEPGGRLCFSRSELQWSLRGERLLLRLADGTEFGAAWRRTPETLVLTTSLWPAEMVLLPGPPSDQESLDPAWRALQRGDHRQAVSLLTPWLRHADRAVEAREGLLAACSALADEQAVRQHLDWFRERHARALRVQETGAQEAGARETGEDLLRALLAAGDVDGAVASACDLAARDPAHAAPWDTLVHCAERPRHRDRLETVVAAALAALPREHHLRPGVLRLRGMLLSARDPQAALQSWADAFLLDGDVDFMARELRLHREVFGRELLQDWARGVTLTDEQRRRLDAVLDDAQRDGGSPEEILTEHLRQIVRLCRAAGAEPILLGYPFRDTTIERAVRTVAKGVGVRWIDLASGFDRLPAGSDRASLFVLDGHLGDRGYEAMAGIVLEQIFRR